MYSTPAKPALAAASKRSRKSCSVKSIDRLAENLGMASSSIQQRDRRRRVLVLLRQFLELDNRVDLGAHRDVGDPLQDELEDDRHPVLLRQPLRLAERRRALFRLAHPDRLAAHRLG